MKKLVLTAFALALLLPGVASTEPAGQTGFMKTSRKFNENDNYEQACRDEFGRAARVADWRDVKKYSHDNKGMQAFMSDAGLFSKRQSALIYSRDEKWGPRHEAFIIQMRNHEPSKRGETVIDDIDNHLFELKVRNNNAKPVLCFKPPHEYKGYEGHVDDDDDARWEGGRPDKLLPHPNPRPEPAPAPHGPALRSTTRAYREFARLNDKCRKEFGPDARVADWSDIKRMVNTRREYEDFLQDNDLSGGSRERLMYFNGQYKSPRDKHYYMIYNPDAETPHGVNAIDRLRNNKLNAAAIMHIRARVLCYVP